MKLKWMKVAQHTFKVRGKLIRRVTVEIPFDWWKTKNALRVFNRRRTKEVLRSKLTPAAG